MIGKIGDKIKELADKFETPEFVPADPVRFPRSVMETGGSDRDVEVSAVISSWLAYGRRDVFLGVLDDIHNMMGESPYDFIMGQRFGIWENDRRVLYRFFSHHDLFVLCQRLRNIYLYGGGVDRMVASDTHDSTPVLSLCRLFKDVKGFPKDDKSACKRLCMLLRWMVRKDSPVDIGIWDGISPKDLLVPLDTHSHATALRLGLTRRKAADMRTAVEITERMLEIFPDDPARGDFALYGYGVININN